LKARRRKYYYSYSIATGQGTCYVFSGIERVFNGDCMMNRKRSDPSLTGMHLAKAHVGRLTEIYDTPGVCANWT